MKPQFYRRPPEQLIKSLRPWDRISIDFKGPLSGKHKYLLIVVDEFSRFPFAFPCSNMMTETVIQCLSELFCLFGYPLYMHSNRGAFFMSQELKRYLTECGIASSKTTPYNPTGNAQCERINQTIWRTIKLLLRTYKESENCWEAVLPEALHAVCSLLCTATNATPHEHFLGFNQRSTSGRALPSFLIQPGPVLLRQFIRSKNDPLVEEVKLLDANLSYSYVRFANGQESTVSTGDLASKPVDNFEVTNVRQTLTTDPEPENRKLSNP